MADWRTNFRRAEKIKIMNIKDYKGIILKNEPMKKHTTWKIGGNARFFALPKNEFDIPKLVNYFSSNDIKYHFIGNGSNILVSDKGINGAVICCKNIKSISYINFGKLKSEIYIGSGVTTQEMISFLKESCFSGLEFLTGIPANFGGLLKMNAGAWGEEICKITKSINIWSEKTGFKTIPRKNLKFGYRKLALPSNFCILGGVVVLVKKNSDDIEKKVSFIMEQRKIKQPLDKPSCGSVFKNPKNDYAGRLIEELGFKGYKIGGAKVSEKHANFIVNEKNAKAEDVLNIIKTIKDRVLEKFGIKLCEEFEKLGFDGEESICA